MYKPRPGPPGAYRPDYDNGMVSPHVLLATWGLWHGLRHWGGFPRDLIIRAWKREDKDEEC